MGSSEGKGLGVVGMYMLSASYQRKAVPYGRCVRSFRQYKVPAEGGGTRMLIDRRSLTRRVPNFEAGCDHRRCSIRVVFTELGCHARCLGCGAVGPPCLGSNDARQALMAPKLEQASARY
jgi:hypothetical protein